MSFIIDRAAVAAGLALVALTGPAVAQDASASAPVARAVDYAQLAALPDWSGVWSIGVGGEGRRPAKPVLTPAAQARFDAFQKKQAEEGVDQFANIHCIPPGMPDIMREPYPIEIIYSPNRVTIFAETYGQARRIYTDGRALPEDPDPLFNGTSVGHWEGDTLVVDTVGFNAMVELAPGVPHSGNMRIRERIWLASPDVLRIETTITDPEVLAEPLVHQSTYRKQPGWEIREYVCAENNRLVEGENGANIDLGLDDEGEDPFGALPE
ncbi:hypothetical protein GRI75_05690 [Altererythrobacter soli]|uniref:Uncharacterized protein n=1 Tax=Croceibacterium soli TaxID=1739690 RepID=A0A6I4UUI1_9SPHN|nr:hypothetical protein [Croceibacterium soli]MXP41137.1 hypothetical protein [Croceibacterium soli]